MKKILKISFIFIFVLYSLYIVFKDIPYQKLTKEEHKIEKSDDFYDDFYKIIPGVI